MGFWMDGLVSIPDRSKSFFSSPQPTERSIEWVQGALVPGVKRPGRETDHSPPSTAEVKNDGAIPPLSHTSSWYT
jgi:hypothetical protein